MTLTVCMLSSAHMCVDRTLAGTRLAVVAMSPTRYDTKGVQYTVYALKHTHACREHARKPVPCCHDAVSASQ